MRLTQVITTDLQRFIRATASAWMNPAEGLVKRNSFGVEILVARQPRSEFAEADVHHFGASHFDMPHNNIWYEDNAHGKNLVCLATGMDSHEAVRLYQGALRNVDGAFPWGGAIIDKAYGIIVGVSGFKEDEDILFARTIRNYLVMLMDREGQSVLDNARSGGEDDATDPSDRFTRRIDGEANP